MLIRCGYDLLFDVPAPVVVATRLRVRPSLKPCLREPDTIQTDPAVPIEEWIDEYGNHAARFLAPAGQVRLFSRSLIEIPADPDPIPFDAPQHAVEDLPVETLQFLLASRYCEVDLLSALAWDLFGWTPLGWPRVQAVLDWVHSKVMFGYPFARPTKTALDTLTERTGVCRDLQHLAIAFCRGLNIPARYATGYLGDIGIPYDPNPMDFSAWFEVYLGGRWWTCDARHNHPRIGRILIATGRDAVDVAMTTSFGAIVLKQFTVITDEVQGAVGAP